MTYWNTQDQQKIVWPPSFALARAYLDQLERSKGLAAETIASARTALANAERRSGAQRKTALTELASQLNAAAGAPAIRRRCGRSRRPSPTWPTRRADSRRFSMNPIDYDVVEK